MTLWMARRLAYMAHANSALTDLTGLLPSISRILPVFIRLYAAGRRTSRRSYAWEEIYSELRSPHSHFASSSLTHLNAVSPSVTVHHSQYPSSPGPVSLSYSIRHLVFMEIGASYRNRTDIGEVQALYSTIELSWQNWRPSLDSNQD